MIKIIPAILTNDVSDLKNKLKKIRGLTDWIQIDIMDGKFVKNTSVRLEAIANLNILKNFSIEIHLMVKDPEKYFPACQKIGAKKIIFHFEATADLKNILAKAKKFKFQKGLALNPETSIKKIKPYLSELDFILLMSVRPGWQEQKFIYSVLEKIKKLKKLAPHVKIEVDGGINFDNIKIISVAGADRLAIGSDLFKHKNIKQYFKKLTRKLN